MLEWARKYVEVYRRYARRGVDLEGFMAGHRALFDEARRMGDYAPVASAHYVFMADVFEIAVGGSWHLAPPQHPNQALDGALRALHQRIARWLEHGPGKRALDVGCGLGDAMRDIAVASGGQVVGIEPGADTIARVRRRNLAAGLAGMLRVECGDALRVPFDEASFDSAYAMDALKYVTRLEDAFREIHRALKPGSVFVVYGMMRTDVRDTTGLMDDFEYGFALPPLHSAARYVEAGTRAGFHLESSMDLDSATTSGGWCEYFTGDPVLGWALDSELLGHAIAAAESAKVLPAGSRRFNETFLTGALRRLVHARREGLITGSGVLIFRSRT
jgi:ubiquinone/menaquinone biosynthesis C-methylase UbiE